MQHSVDDAAYIVGASGDGATPHESVKSSHEYRAPRKGPVYGAAIMPPPEGDLKMMTVFTIGRMARAAALALLLAAPALTAAYADDEYGTQHETLIRQVAASTPSRPLTAADIHALSDVFKVGMNDAFGASRSSHLAATGPSYKVQRLPVAQSRR